MKFLLYWLRWEASTPILAACTFFLASRLGDFWSAFVANTIGAALFFMVDRRIFGAKDKRLENPKGMQ